MFSSKVETNASNPVHEMREYLNWFIPEKHYKEKEKRILYLIKSCENYDLDEKESIKSINKVLGSESISRRTYYNYKKKLYDNQIFSLLKNSLYNSYGVKLGLLDCILDDWERTSRADELIGQQFPERKPILDDEDRQKIELDKLMEKHKTKFNKLKKEIEIKLSNKNSLLPLRHIIKEEYIKCGKEGCTKCPHGPYYYAYYKKDNNKTRKKYLGN
jgi:hypothetical protein